MVMVATIFTVTAVTFFVLLAHATHELGKTYT
jgi:hypothetical protein